MEILWLILAVAFLAIEFATVALISLWFVVGALAALAAAILGVAPWLQVLIFALVSMAMLLLLRPFLRKFVDPHKVPTNVDAVIGHEAVVTETVDNLAATGAIRLGGVTWTARAVNGKTIPAGTVVTVQAVEGVKVMVASAPHAASKQI